VLVIYHYGGLYADADVRLNGSVSTMLAEAGFDPALHDIAVVEEHPITEKVRPV
jgi:mannosyltransferase OCH1-like enzyme